MLLTIFTASIAGAQYKGGYSDGSSMVIKLNLNPLVNIYKGGYSDGSAAVTITGKNMLPNIYRGGPSDGFTMVQVFFQNAQYNIYAGGDGDGSDDTLIVNINSLLNIYKGGDADGFAVIQLNNRNPVVDIYAGGEGDGFASSAALMQNVLNNIYAGGDYDGFSIAVIINQNPLSTAKVITPTVMQQPELTINKSSVYPNPGNGIFNISIEGNKEFNTYSYRIFSAGGSLITSGKITGPVTQFNIGQMPAGVYYIQVYKNNLPQHNHKIILQH